MRKRRPGLTLVEMLVSMALLGVLGVALARIYDVSRTAYASGTGTIALQQRARILMERITPLVVSALPPTGSDAAIASPPPDGSLASTLIFYIPARNFDARNPQYTRARIRQETDGTVKLDRDTANPDDDRVLARDIKKLQFAVVAQNVVRVSIEVYGTTRGAANRDKAQYYLLETLVQIPYYSKS